MISGLTSAIVQRYRSPALVARAALHNKREPHCTIRRPYNSVGWPTGCGLKSTGLYCLVIRCRLASALACLRAWDRSHFRCRLRHALRQNRWFDVRCSKMSPQRQYAHPTSRSGSKSSGSSWWMKSSSTVRAIDHYPTDISLSRIFRVMSCAAIMTNEHS